MRGFLGFLVFAGFGVAIGAGILAVRQQTLTESVVLEVEPAVDLTPPPPAPPPAEAAGITAAPVAPLAVRFAGVDIDEDIRPVGLRDDGGLEIPGADEIGWWRFGSSPGLPGTTVLAAHVSWNGALGPFFRLGDAQIGDQLEVTAGDGSIRRYQVVERTMYMKGGLPTDRIWTTSGDETLVLITCGGEFNDDIHRYRHNIVVFATPVGTVTTDA